MAEYIKLLREAEVLERTGYGRTPFFEARRAGRFVQPVKRGRTALYPDHEVDALVRADMARLTDSEKVALVEQLHAARRQVV